MLRTCCHLRAPSSKFLLVMFLQFDLRSPTRTDCIQKDLKIGICLIEIAKFHAKRAVKAGKHSRGEFQTLKVATREEEKSWS